MCVIVVIWAEWADVGLWVAVCFLAKISLHRSTCKTTFARLTQSQAISQSFRVFISFRSMRDTTFFSFFETLFDTKLPFPLPWWSKDLLVDLAGGGQSTSKSTCEVPAWTLTAFGDRSASQHVQIEAGLNSDPGNDSFWDKSRDAKHVDRSTHYSTCRSTQVKIASTDLWPQGMFTFSEMLALVESESSFGAYVCHRRPGGSLATSDLVQPGAVKLVLWRHWMHPSYMHPVTSENKFHCTMRYIPNQTTAMRRKTQIRAFGHRLTPCNVLLMFSSRCTAFSSQLHEVLPQASSQSNQNKSEKREKTSFLPEVNLSRLGSSERSSAASFFAI